LVLNASSSQKKIHGKNAVPSYSKGRKFPDQNCDITRLRNKLFVFAN
jgi:hypothetical protein